MILVSQAAWPSTRVGIVFDAIDGFCGEVADGVPAGSRVWLSKVYESTCFSDLHVAFTVPSTTCVKIQHVAVVLIQVIHR